MSGRAADTTQFQAGMQLRMGLGRESCKGEHEQKLQEQNPEFFIFFSLASFSKGG